MSSSLKLEQFIERLRERGFSLATDPDGNGYWIREQETEISNSTSRLAVESATFDEYFDAAFSHWTLPSGSAERGDEIISIMVMYVESALSSLDADARNCVAEIGIRRDSAGRVDWYKIEDPPRAEQPARKTRLDPELQWIANPQPTERPG